jgi:hypothetical protein
MGRPLDGKPCSQLNEEATENRITTDRKELTA